LYERVTFELVLFAYILGDGNVEVALYALVLLELEVSPLPLIDELLECLLQILKDACVSPLDLAVVNVDPCL
jgi:hypothetical protein